jgi:hypothetical protein
VNAALAPLYEWQKTADFARLVSELDSDARERLLIDSKLKPLREALILRDFAVTLGYSECKLCQEDERFPDGKLRSPGTVLQIEITEVLTPDRKRDQEFKAFANCPSEKTLSHHEWEEVKQAGLNWTDWIAEGIKKKLKYDKNVKFDIVVYNNISHLFEMPEIAQLSKNVGDLLAEAGYQNHWVWQCRSTTIDLLWPRVLRFKIPGWEDRF